MVKKIKPLVSIIIRGKNESRWLKILFNKLLVQSCRNFEIVFCDNNSSDNTLKILQNYNIKKIIRFKEYIPGKVLNNAIKKCSGKYISILSSHCIPVNNHWLKQHLDAIESSANIAAVFGKQIPMPGTSIQNLIDLDMIFKNQQITYVKDPYLNNANSLYKSEVLKKNLFDTKVTNIEDRIWANKIVKKNFKIIYSAKSSVFHLHGIHQHIESSKRAETTYNILRKKYKSIWNKCDFLKPQFNNFCLIINARRIKNRKLLVLKIGKLKRKLNRLNTKIKKIFVITDLNLSNDFKNIIHLKCKRTLKDDLKNLYKKFDKLWIKTNYGIYFNFKENFEIKKINRLTNLLTFYNYESVTTAQNINENFIIDFRGKEKFKSIELDNIENKPTITLLKWSKGCVFDVDYLRKGILFSNNTHINIL